MGLPILPVFPLNLSSNVAPPSPRGIPWIVFVLLLVPIAMGAWDLCVQHWRLTRYRPVEAVVLESGIEFRGRTNSGGTWRPSIRYAYVVNGWKYTGSRVTPLDIVGDAEWADEVADRYPQGAKVTAYHHPDRPEHAYLVRQASPVPRRYIVGPLVMLAAAMVLTLLGRRRAARPSPAPAP